MPNFCTYIVKYFMQIDTHTKQFVVHIHPDRLPHGSQCFLHYNAQPKTPNHEESKLLVLDPRRTYVDIKSHVLITASHDYHVMCA